MLFGENVYNFGDGEEKHPSLHEGCFSSPSPKSPKITKSSLYL